MPRIDYESESPFLSGLHIQIADWTDGYICAEFSVTPQHLNRSGVLHGGLIATLLDYVGGLSGLYCNILENRRYGVTVSLTVNYLAQMRTGKLLAKGSRKHGGRSIYFTNAEIRTKSGDLLATGAGVYKYRKGSERLEGVPIVPRNLKHQ